MIKLYRVLFGFLIISGTYLLSKQVFEQPFKKGINFSFEKLPIFIKIALKLFGDVKKYKNKTLWSEKAFPAGDKFPSQEQTEILTPFIGFILLCIGTLAMVLM